MITRDAAANQIADACRRQGLRGYVEQQPAVKAFARSIAAVERGMLTDELRQRIDDYWAHEAECIRNAEGISSDRFNPHVLDVILLDALSEAYENAESPA